MSPKKPSPLQQIESQILKFFILRARLLLSDIVGWRGDFVMALIELFSVFLLSEFSSPHCIVVVVLTKPILVFSTETVGANTFSSAAGSTIQHPLEFESKSFLGSLSLLAYIFHRPWKGATLQIYIHVQSPKSPYITNVPFLPSSTETKEHVCHPELCTSFGKHAPA